MSRIQEWSGGKSKSRATHIKRNHDSKEGEVRYQESEEVEERRGEERARRRGG